MIDEGEEAVLGGSLHIGDPVRRQADAEQRVLAKACEQNWLGEWRGHRRIARRSNLFHQFPHLHDLDGAGAWMPLDPAALGPSVGGILVVDAGQQQAGAGPVHDEAHVRVSASDQKFGSRDAPMRRPWEDASIYRSKAAVLAAFCDVPSSRASAAVKVSAMRNSKSFRLV